MYIYSICAPLCLVSSLWPCAVRHKSTFKLKIHSNSTPSDKSSRNQPTKCFEAFRMVWFKPPTTHTPTHKKTRHTKNVCTAFSHIISWMQDKTIDKWYVHTDVSEINENNMWINLWFANSKAVDYILASRYSLYTYVHIHSWLRYHVVILVTDKRMPWLRWVSMSKYWATGHVHFGQRLRLAFTRQKRSVFIQDKQKTAFRSRQQRRDDNSSSLRSIPTYWWLKPIYQSTLYVFEH